MGALSRSKCVAYLGEGVGGNTRMLVHYAAARARREVNWERGHVTFGGKLEFVKRCLIGV